MKTPTPAVVLHVEGAENDRDREGILARLESETDRHGALGSILDATVRRGLQREITRERAALVIVNRWRQSMRASAHAPSTPLL